MIHLFLVYLFVILTIIALVRVTILLIRRIRKDLNL
jgi:hypothetical protein